MFSFKSKNEDFGAQSKIFNNTIVNNFRQNFSFMNDAGQVKMFNTTIDNMLTFLTNKLKITESISAKSSNNFKLTDINISEEDIKFFVSLGMVKLMTQNEMKLKMHLQLIELNDAEFQQIPLVIEGFIQYLKEYIQKLTALKELSIEKEVLPEITGFQNEIRTKLDYFLQKNKAMIFDIYLNHYVQYMYLIFAINIFKKSEIFFKINARQQKQIALIAKTDQLAKVFESLSVKDEGNMKKINENIQYLIDQTSKVSQFNKVNPRQQEILAEIDKKNVSQLKKDTTKQKGGTSPTVVIPTPKADLIIDKIITRHNHFLNVYTTTRNSMPEYFKTINDLIISKIAQLQEMQNEIMKLSDKDIELLMKTDASISKFMDFDNNKDLQDGYDSKTHPVMQQNIKDNLEAISSEIQSSIQSSKQQALNIANETEQLQKVYSDSTNNQQPQQPQQPQQTGVVVGGFVRGQTRFPKNNYIKK